MKTILITGSTDGIGKLTANQIAQQGHRVLIHGRDAQKLAGVVNEIKTMTGNEHVQGFQADLSQLHQVKPLADDIIKEVSSLDVLINNAGVYYSPIEVTTDGLDIRFVVNYLSPIILTNALQPLLRNSQAPRIINLSSAAQAPVRLTALTGEEEIGAQRAYAQSKLALTMWSFYLAQQWPFATVVAVNPGSLLNTKMVKEAFGQHWAPVDKGAQILNELALVDHFANATGKYFDNDIGDFNMAHTDAYDSQKVTELLRVTQSIIASYESLS